MDIFKFINPVHPTKLDQGQLINGLKSKLWIERYRDVSEFELIADVETDMRNVLPIGTLVSHVDTDEVMVVENHEIREDSGQKTDIKITGRSFESYLENRIVGSNKAWPTTASATTEYVLGAAYTWQQLVTMIQDHIYTSKVIDQNDAVANVVVMTNVPGIGVAESRPIARGDLYTRSIELLNVDNLGIKAVRPGSRSPLGASDPNMVILVHEGLDLSSQVVFSSITGEIESADYLWSNKKAKNAILVTGRWIETVVKDPGVGYSRRTMFLEASDIDSAYSTAPTGTARDSVIAQMQARGRAALAAQKELTLVKTDANKNASTYKYREHFEVGDIVTVEGSFSETRPMRVAEYVEIEDETGQSGYPTLTAL